MNVFYLLSQLHSFLATDEESAEKSGCAPTKFLLLHSNSIHRVQFLQFAAINEWNCRNCKHFPTKKWLLLNLHWLSFIFLHQSDFVPSMLMKKINFRYFDWILVLIKLFPVEKWCKKRWSKLRSLSHLLSWDHSWNFSYLSYKTFLLEEK